MYEASTAAASCVAAGCINARSAKGLCKTHYLAAYNARPERKLQRAVYRSKPENKLRRALRNAAPSYRQRRAEASTRLHSRFKVAVAKSARAGREWTLTWDSYAAMLQQPCHYCAGALNRTGSGLDRLDNAKGYIIGNVAPCCRICNNIKGPHLTEEEMLAAMAAVKEVRRRHQ